MTINFEWQYQDEQANTLKGFLKRRGVSHRLFLALRKDRLLMVNGNDAIANPKLVAGDVVQINLPDETSDDLVATSTEPLAICYEDANWLVINKPAGLTCVPGPSNRTDTLVNRIKGHLIATGSENLRPHLITRLDRFTSGLVLVAKHRLANSIAAQQVLAHQIQKEYVALVSGQLKRDHALIDFPIGKADDEIRRHRMADGQDAQTEYWVKRRFADFTAVRVLLHTGRTHQIRVHFADLGHPLLGDQLYDGPLDLINRQALHASYLRFFDPFAGKELAFTAPVPEDMARLIQGRGK